MDIEKAKELVEELNWSHFDMSETASNVYVEAIDIVLSELEKKDTEIIEAKEANRQLSLELEKKEKQIDLMAEQLAGLAIFDIEKDEPLVLGDKEEVKQYFTNKVEKEGK